MDASENTMTNHASVPPHLRLGLWGATVAALLLVTGATYVLLHGIYRPENTDDAWSLSFAHNYVHRGITYDMNFGMSHRGVALFGKGHACVYGRVLDTVGWNKSNAHLISAAFMLLSAGVWHRIAIKLGYGRRQAGALALLMLLVEPFFGAANQARADAMTFFLDSLALLLFVCRLDLLSGLCATAAVENHPMGVMSLLYILALGMSQARTLLADRKTLARRAGFFFLGLGIGAAGYLCLHGRFVHYVSEVFRKENLGQGARVGNFLVEYFLRTKYYRHLPELVLILASLGVFLAHRRYRQRPFPLILLGVMLGSTILIRHPSFHYAVYVYPAFLLIVMSAFPSPRQLAGALLTAMILLVPQYAFVFYKNHDHSFPRYVREIHSAVPDDGLPVIGRANDWFAFLDRPFYWVEYNGDLTKLGLREFYLIAGRDYGQPECARTRAFVEGFFVNRRETVTADRENLEILHLTSKP